MKLCTYAIDTPLGTATRVGVVTNAGIVDATAARVALLERSLPPAAAQRVGAAQVPPDMIELIASGKPALDWLREALAFIADKGIEATAGRQRLHHALGSVKLLAPVPRPAGLANFSVWPGHTALAAAKGLANSANTAGARVKPYWKGNPDSVVGDGADLAYPPYSTELDVECELACIVGTGGKNLTLEQAADAIAGYTVLNDVSARAIQKVEKKSGRGPSKGKDFDGGNVMGPWLVTPDEVGDVHGLRLSLHINGEEVSGSSTESMIWDYAEMLSYLSLGQTVHPGQVITGGCYPMGSAMELDRELHPGDAIELKITRIGTLRCTIGRKPEKLAYPIED